MSKILVIAEHDGKKLNQATARCVTCAKQIPGAEVTVAVFAADPAAVAAQAAALAGVARVVTIAAAHNAHALAAVLAPQVVKLAADYTHLLGASTAFGKDLMPRVAALLGVPQISDAMSVEGAYKFKRPTYAGNAIVTLEAPADRKVVATVRSASFEAAGTGGSAPVSAVALDVAVPGHTRFVSISAATSDRPDLASAPKVVSGGRALGSKENFDLIFKLAEKMGAAVGASRAAVDAGYAPNELQVGQTGKIIAPELYVAIGISGAIQHLTGIKDAKTIVAINKDGEAPIFEVADFGLVGDLFQIVPELEKSLGK
ncbi:MAG TPA: electron transfer flavoprotein subunit alpha/FixB family protein [Steroidobacteraceae bacterium]|nr:electron transfer flavoprotein subunit alpha/FixB family protein [Steroidobacteraceae bacterium]